MIHYAATMPLFTQRVCILLGYYYAAAMLRRHADDTLDITLMLIFFHYADDIAAAFTRQRLSAIASRAITLLPLPHDSILRIRHTRQPGLRRYAAVTLTRALRFTPPFTLPPLPFH